MASREQKPMTDEHKQLLNRNLPELTKSLQLTTGFWALLISFLVLTIPDKQRIEAAGPADEDRVLALVGFLQRKNDDCFHHFVSALRQTGQHHLVAVLNIKEAHPTPGTVTGAARLTPETTTTSGKTMRDLQLMMVKSVLRLCSTVETWTWAADKKYVPIGQIFTDLVWVKDEGHTALGNYTQMFKDEENRPSTFVFLQGLAGSGKSTLVQMLNVKWCRLIQRKWEDRKVKLSEDEATLYSNYNYVILIFLRHVKQGQGLQDVIQRQYCLGPKNAAILISKIMQYPEESLIYLEGYDEYVESTSPEITDIAHRNIFQEATLVITSRHSPTYHFPDSQERSVKPDTHVLLRGFSPDGVSQYINNFFLNLDKTKAAPLVKKIKQSDELTHLSCFPAILLLMCTLWEHEGSLSDSITGFFLKFVAYVCGRYESKFVKPTQRAISKNIIKKYHGCLMKIGEISVDGLREDKLQLSFLFKDVMEKLGETAWQLGFLKRESNMEGEELVVFPHKTMQEFFTAYFVVNCDKVKQKELLVQFCSSIQAVKESEMIQTFISGLGGEGIKKEIDRIIQGSDEGDMAKIIPALQLSYLAENRNAQLKLPARVDLEVTDRYREEVYKLYMDNDCTAVTHLTVEARGYQSVTDKAILPSIFNMSRLTELRFGYHSLSVSGLGTLSHILTTQNIQLTTLDLEAAVVEDVPGALWPSLMASLPVTLETLLVSHNNMTDESTRQLSLRASQLTQLHVIRMGGCNLSDAGAVLEIIKNCQTLTVFSVSWNKLGDDLVEIINLTPNMAALRRLSLNNNNLSDHVIDRIRRQLSKDLPQLTLYV